MLSVSRWCASTGFRKRRRWQRRPALAPDRARYAYVYAIALNSGGERDAASRVLEASHARHPADRETLTALVSLAREAGDPTAALRYARPLAQLAPDDPGVAKLLQELEGAERD